VSAQPSGKSSGAATGSGAGVGEGSGGGASMRAPARSVAASGVGAGAADRRGGDGGGGPEARWPAGTGRCGRATGGGSGGLTAGGAFCLARSTSAASWLLLIGMAVTSDAHCCQGRAESGKGTLEGGVGNNVLANLARRVTMGDGYRAAGLASGRLM
jgi:hypothetical protein